MMKNGVTLVMIHVIDFVVVLASLLQLTIAEFFTKGTQVVEQVPRKATGL